MFGQKSAGARRLGQKSIYSARIGNQKKHRGRHKFLNTHFPNSVPVNNAMRVKKSKTSGQLGE